MRSPKLCLQAVLSKAWNVRHEIILFLVALFSYHYVGWILGAPFMTPDSRDYFRMAEAPWNHFGGHYPSGFPWLVAISRCLGISERAIISLLSATRFLLLYLILLRCGWGKLALLAASVVSLWPEMLVLDFSAWTESLFLTLLLGAVYCLVTIHSKGGRLAALAILFLLMAETRHAAIFFLPALGLGFASTLLRIGDSPRHQLRAFVGNTAIGCVVLGCTWMALNIARNGNPLRPSHARFECVQYLAAFNVLNYCKLVPNLPLCEIDPERKYMGNPAVEAHVFIYDKAAPLIRSKASVDQVCEMWGTVKLALMGRSRFDVFYLIFTRFIHQFLMWSGPERGAPLYDVRIEGADRTFDSLIITSNNWTWVLAWMLGIPLAVMFRRWQLWTLPSVVVLFFGGIGHALGIAINNPFFVLRYMLVHRYAVVIAGICAVPYVYRWCLERRAKVKSSK